MSIENLTKAIVITAEVMGHELTKAAARDMALELSAYPEESVAAALRRCKTELSGRLTLAAVFSRIPDGHPGADEAWALCPKSENDAAVWTHQIAEAFGYVRELLEAGDTVAARMAFREAYANALRGAKEARKPAEWVVTPGLNRAATEAAVRRAVEAGRITAKQAKHYVPQLDAPPEHKALPAPERDKGPALAADDFAELLKKLKGGQ